MIILDANCLVRALVVEEDSEDAARFRGLLKDAKDAGVVVGIPAPAFAEFLVRTDEATAELLNAFERRQAIRILPFDKRAAHECAQLDRAALASGAKRQGSKDAWQKVKVDRQIVAIARVHNAQLLLTSDAGLTTIAAAAGLNVSDIRALPLPPDALQRSLDLKPPEA